MLLDNNPCCPCMYLLIVSPILIDLPEMAYC
jgi:hypothetical protein